MLRKFKQLRSVVEELSSFQASSGLANNIKDLKDKLPVPCYRVGCLGQTGVGKTTFLNAILGVPILPEGDSGEAGTTICTQIEYNDTYEAELLLVGPESWRKEMENMLKFAVAAEDEEGKDSRLKMFEAVYPDIDVKDVTCFDDLPLTEVTEKLHSQRSIKLEGATPSDIAQQLRSYMKADGPWWPCVESVIVKAPIKVLENGLVLVDFPGCGDVNAARNNIFKKHLRELDELVIVGESKRPKSEKAFLDLIKDTVQDLGEHIDIQHRSSVTVVLTKGEVGLDRMDKYMRILKEFNREDETKELRPKQKHAIACHLNMQHIEKGVHQVLVSHLEEAKLIRKVELKVFATSAQQFLLRCSDNEEDHLDSFMQKEQTGIPGFREHLRKKGPQPVQLAEATKCVGYYIDGLIEEPVMRCSKAEKKVSDGVHAIKTELEESFSQGRLVIDQTLNIPIAAGLQHAQLCLLHTRDSWKKIHWKSFGKACREGGVHAAKRINLNKDIVKPMWECHEVRSRWATLDEYLARDLRNSFQQDRQGLVQSLDQLTTTLQGIVDESTILHFSDKVKRGFEHEAKLASLEPGSRLHRDVSQRIREAADEPESSALAAMLGGYADTAALEANYDPELGGPWEQMLSTILQRMEEDIDLPNQSVMVSQVLHVGDIIQRHRQQYLNAVISLIDVAHACFKHDQSRASSLPEQQTRLKSLTELQKQVKDLCPVPLNKDRQTNPQTPPTRAHHPDPSRASSSKRPRLS